VTIEGEIRISDDRPQMLEERAQKYADALAGQLEDAKGNWGEGMYFPGAYEIKYGALRPGGKRFLKSVFLSFEVEARVD